MIVTLPCGTECLIDDADWPTVPGYRWFLDRRKHTAYVRGYRIGARGKKTYLHQLITGESRTDHKNGNGLDCRRENLRGCSQADNVLNAGEKRPHKRFKGVYFAAGRGRWWAQIYFQRKSHFLGYHETEEAAAAAYDAAAQRLHGEFARLNSRPATVHWITA